MKSSYEHRKIYRNSGYQDTKVYPRCRVFVNLNDPFSISFNFGTLELTK